jgi:hypothetical protein
MLGGANLTNGYPNKNNNKNNNKVKSKPLELRSRVKKIEKETLETGDMPQKVLFGPIEGR